MGAGTGVLAFASELARTDAVQTNHLGVETVDESESEEMWSWS